MSFSFTNVANLEFLYCNSTQDPSINTITLDNIKLKKKYEGYFNPLTQKIIDFVNASRWIREGHVKRADGKFDVFMKNSEAFVSFIPLKHALVGMYHWIHAIQQTFHRVHEGHLTHEGYDFEGCDTEDKLKSFVTTISARLTYRFRHEILMISNEDCKTLVSCHFKQIEEFLKKEAEHHTARDTKTLLKSIVDYVDPDPEVQIKQRIDDYIKQRASRGILHSKKNQNREQFLLQFKKNLDENSSDKCELINELGLSVFFKDDWMWDKTEKTIIYTNRRLGLNNNLIGQLKLYSEIDLQKSSDGKKDKKIKKVFNNQFFTHLFYKKHSLNKVVKEIMLLLMRSLVIEETNCLHDMNKLSKEIIRDIYSSHKPIKIEDMDKLKSRVVDEVLSKLK